MEKETVIRITPEELMEILKRKLNIEFSVGDMSFSRHGVRIRVTA